MSTNVKPGAKKEEGLRGLVPKLRFPEFRGAWKANRIETLGYFTGGGTPSKGNALYWTGDIPWISSSDLTEDSISQINVTRFITKQAVQESATKLVPAKSILLISRVGVGKLAVSTFPLCTSQDFTNFTPTAADPLFLAYLLKSQKETLLSFNQGTSIKGFTKENIANLALGFPSSAEQQKIAECLSSVDELMVAQARKVDALKTHKKALMQQLFPREGETQPRLRFPEFQKAGEWGQMTLGDVGDFKNGVNFSAEKKGRGILTVDVLNMYGLGIEMKLDGLYRVDVEAGDYLLSGGDVLFVRSSMKREGVGWASLFRGCSEPVIFCGFLIRLRLKSFTSTDPEFLSQYLRSASGRGKIIAVSGTAAITNVSQDSLKGVTFPFPPLPEQQRIALCLSSLDALIDAETQTLETLKTHKKGLMQQLFPTPEEN